MRYKLVLLAGLVCGSCFAQTGDRQAIIDAAFRNRISEINDVWFDDGDFPRIVSLMESLYEYAPSDFEVATDLGWMYENIELYDKALALYIRFRISNPSDPDSPFPEANFYFRRRQFTKIPALLENTLPRNPHPNNFRILGHTYSRMGMHADSVRVWKLYVSKHPDDLRGKQNLKNAEDKLRAAGRR